jgi:predicted nuclease of predicted toxin-antitoxin system
VRLLLDANLSPRRIAVPLRDAGHDVLTPAQDASYEGLADPAVVLDLAATQGRVMITRNSRDFAPLAREWAEAQRMHAGMILIWTLDHSQVGAIVDGVQTLLAERPEQQQWRDLVLAI